MRSLTQGWITTITTNKALPLSERFKKIVRLQLKIGAFGFGGPLAAISMMKKEFVEDEKLVSNKDFLEALAFVKLLPGPVSTMLAIYLGKELAGILGGLVSGICYILPSFLLMLALSNFESLIEHSSISSLSLSLNPLLATILGMIVFTCYKLFKESVDYAKSQGPQDVFFAYFIFLVAGIFAYFKVLEVIVLVGCGILGVFWKKYLSSSQKLNVALFPVFMVFFWAAFSVFGTGYMVLPALQRVIVEKNAWLTASEFLRGVTYGNLTPGPIVIASTYFGYKMSGNMGAFAATVGIFTPPFVLLLLLGSSLKKIFSSSWTRGFVDGVIPAVSSSIMISLIPLSKSVSWNPFLFAALLLGFVMSLRKVSAFAVLFAGVLLIFVERIMPGLH